VQRDNWDLSAFYSYTENQLEDLNSPPPFVVDSRLEQVGHEVEAVLNYQQGERAVYTLGLGHYDYEFDRNPLNASSTLQSSNQYAYSSIFGQADVEFGGGFGLLASVRHDAHDSYDDATTYTVQLQYLCSLSGAKFYLKNATGYKVPSGQDLLFLDPSINPSALEPESSDSWEIGLQKSFLEDSARLSLAYFVSDITDLIDNDPNTFAFSQVDSESKGVELETRFAIADGLDLYANYTYLDAVVAAGSGFTGLSGDRLLRRPKHIISAGAHYRADCWSLGLELQGYYDREDIDSALFTRTSLEDFLLARVVGSYQVSENCQLYGRVENLFDEDYESSDGYEGRGLGAFAGVRVNFAQ